MPLFQLGGLLATAGNRRGRGAGAAPRALGGRSLPLCLQLSLGLPGPEAGSVRAWSWR